jgi:hypothetical protein
MEDSRLRNGRKTMLKRDSLQETSEAKRHPFCYQIDHELLNQLLY